MENGERSSKVLTTFGCMLPEKTGYAFDGVITYYQKRCNLRRRAFRIQQSQKFGSFHSRKTNSRGSSSLSSTIPTEVMQRAYRLLISVTVETRGLKTISLSPTS